MRILIVNDDGINAKGLWALAEALEPLGQVVAIAPDREQSGIGTALTLHHPVRVLEVASPLKSVTAYSVEGTPSDAVILALESFVGRKVDLLVSGINEGANLGDDIFVSGTVGAAWQAYFRGVPSIAVSVTALHNVRFEVATEIVRMMAIKIGEDSLPKPLFLNINVPNLPLRQIQGIEVTQLGRRGFMDIVSEGTDGRRRWYWIARSRPTVQLEEGTDIWATRSARVSITPLQANLTAVDHIAPLSALAHSFLQSFQERGLASEPAPPRNPIRADPTVDNLGG